MPQAKFKSTTRQQIPLLPATYEDKISPNDPVRVVDSIIEKINLKDLYGTYKGGGTSSHDPKMLLKGIIFSYLCNIYSSRKIEEAIKHDVRFIWLCGNCEPDHNTINRFRGKKVGDTLKDIFKQIVLLLAEEGLVSLKEAFVDGTKIEANANRYTFVWGKSIKINKEKMVKRLDELLQYAQTVAKEELKDTEPLDFKTIDSEKVKQTVKAIEEAIKNQEIPEEVKKNLKYAKKNYPDKLDQYKAQEEILDGRNSYSKTDHDATFMRMKEDHLNKGQVKPGYNVQITTNQQIITNYDIFPNPADTLTLPAHMESYKELYGQAPETVTADAGYGSEQNYDHLEADGCTAYVKYNTFYQEQKGKRQKKFPFAGEYLFYNEEKNFYVCPMGQHMHYLDTFTRVNESGYEQTVSRYKAQNCNGCPLRGMCDKENGTRILEINQNMVRHRKKARELLTSEEGIAHRKKRNCDVETVFGNIKHNKKFRRFMLRGKEKVTVEFGLIAIAHNLKKKVA